MTEEQEIDLGKIIAQRQHNQMMNVLSKILTAMEQPKDTELQSLLAANKGMVAIFLSKLQQLSTPQPINVETNQQEVVNSVSESSKNIVDALNNLTQELKKEKEYKATITKRNQAGFADEITLKSK